MRHIVHLVLLCLILCCCTRQKGSTANSEESSDTLTADTVDTVECDFTAKVLPDTAFASAKLIRYVIELKNDTTDSVINNLSSLYTDVPGVFMFRNSPCRQADFGGRVKGSPDSIAVDWEFVTEFDTCRTKFGIWGGGSGWTGQPVYVKWNKHDADKIKQSGIATADFDNEEIIVGSLCGYVYFLNFKTGKISRQPIDAGNPIKGSISLDPELNGNLYVGQGVPARRPFGHMVIDIGKGEIKQFMAEDRKAYRGWGAFDSSPVRVGQFLFWPGENGSLYKYVCKDGHIIPHTVMKYTKNGMAPGMEASISIYRNYGYTADNHGNVLCINLNTMRPVWCFENGDDTDATIVVAEEGGKPFVYTGCEVDRRNDSTAFFRKLDALNGRIIWETPVQGKRFNINDKHFDGGFYASPLLGKGNCNGLIFTNCVINKKRQNGDFIAFDRKTGAIVYRTHLKHYAWSSPVGFTNEKDEMFIFTGDTFGNVYLINGIDGKIIYTCRVGENFESSPVVIDNHVVVGSRGRSIFKMTIK